MTRLLITIPVSANDAPLCERHLTHIFKMNGKKPVGHCLLVFNADIHPEFVVRLRIAAELAFVTVRETTAPKLQDHEANNKFLQLNNMFRHAAKTAQKECRWPWLWLEPDCVPVKPDWIEQLANAYDNQPAKYLGFIGKAADGGKFMARCGIYFLAASYELDSHCQADIPFAIATSSEVIPRCGHTNLIQYTSIERVDDLQKIEPQAVIVHGDKLGIFQENWKPLSETAEYAATLNISEIKDPREQIQAILKGAKESLIESERDYSERVGALVLDGMTEKDAVAKVLADQQRDINAGSLPRLSRRQRRELEQTGAK